MKWAAFVMSVFVVACGSRTDIPPGWEPPQPIESEFATGEYSMFAFMLEDTCDPTFDPETADEIDIGPWHLAVNSEEYLFFSVYYDIIFTSQDGRHFSFQNNSFSMFCEVIEETWTADLVFDEASVDGVISQNIYAYACYGFGEEGSEMECTYTHRVTGY